MRLVGKFLQHILQWKKALLHAQTHTHSCLPHSLSRKLLALQVFVVSFSIVVRVSCDPFTEPQLSPAYVFLVSLVLVRFGPGFDGNALIRQASIHF